MISSKKGSSAGEQTLTWIFYFGFLMFVIFVIVAFVFLEVDFDTNIRSADAATHIGLLHYNNYYNNCGTNCEYNFTEIASKKVAIIYSLLDGETTTYNKITLEILSPLAQEKITEGKGGVEKHIALLPDEEIEVFVKND